MQNCVLCSLSSKSSSPDVTFSPTCAALKYLNVHYSSENESAEVAQLLKDLNYDVPLNADQCCDVLQEVWIVGFFSILFSFVFFNFIGGLTYALLCILF